MCSTKQFRDQTLRRAAARAVLALEGRSAWGLGGGGDCRGGAACGGGARATHATTITATRTTTPSAPSGGPATAASGFHGPTVEEIIRVMHAAGDDNDAIRLRGLTRGSVLGHASRAELDSMLHETVASWLAADWPFTDVRYRNGV